MVRNRDSTQPTLAIHMQLLQCLSWLKDMVGDSQLTFLKYHEIKTQLEKLRDNSNLDLHIRTVLARSCEGLPNSTISAGLHSAGKRRKIESADLERFKNVIAENTLIEEMEAAAQKGVENDLQEALHLCCGLLEDWYGLDISELTVLLGISESHAVDGLPDHK